MSIKRWRMGSDNDLYVYDGARQHPAGEWVLWEDVKARIPDPDDLRLVLDEGLDDYWRTLPENQDAIARLRATLEEA